MEKNIKVNTIKDCLYQLSAYPTESSILALAKACDENDGTPNWRGFGGFDDTIIKSEEILSAICIEAFHDDRTDILDIFNQTFDVTPDFTLSITPFPTPNPELVSYETIVSKLIPHIAAAIIAHKHTETLMHIITPVSIISNYLNNELFSAAVYSGNYPVARSIQEVKPFDIDIPMIRLFMENKKYAHLDLILDDGKFIRQSGIISNIIHEAALTGDFAVLQWISILAERYSPTFDGSEKAEGDFIAQNSDVDTIVSSIYENISRTCNAETEYVLNYLISRGVKLSDAGYVLSACAMSMANQDEMYDELVIKTISKLIGDDSYICYEDIMVSNTRSYEEQWHHNLKMLISKVSENLVKPVRLNICNKVTHYFTEWNVALLKQLLKCCKIDPVQELMPDSVVEHAILCNKSALLGAMLKSDFLADHLFDKMIDMCTRHQSYKCLNEINKYVAKRLCL